MILDPPAPNFGITQEMIDQHLRRDGEIVDAELVAEYFRNAVSTCEAYCNRKFYQDADEQRADFDQALLDYGFAHEEYTNARDATTDCDVLGVLSDRLISARADMKHRCNGKVVDGTMRAAILLTLGHFYENRADNETGQGATAIQLPTGARRILEPYLWIGDIGG